MVAKCDRCMPRIELFIFNKELPDMMILYLFGLCQINFLTQADLYDMHSTPTDVTSLYRDIFHLSNFILVSLIPN
jgi:hypothetical protein